MSVSIAPKRKRFLYKEAKFITEIGDPNVTLESLLTSAVAKLKKASARMKKVADDADVRFLNYHMHHSTGEGQGIFGCEFLGYEHGADQSIINLDPDAEEIDVNAIPAGPDREFLSGAVYFAVKGNHVVLFQSSALRTQELESYLNWLLREAAAVIDKENALLLADNVSDQDKANLKGVKGIRIKAPVTMTSEVKKPAETSMNRVKRTRIAPQTESQSITVHPTGKAWQAFKEFFGDALTLPNRFTVNDLAKIPELQVELLLHFKGHHDEDAGDFLDGLATQMRHVSDEFDYTVEAKHGSCTRDQMKLFKEFSVAWTAKGRPKVEDLFPKMAKWLASLISDGRVLA